MSKHSPYEISHARVEEWAKAYKGKPFHALLCDPPYELGFMGKDWDKSGIVFKPDTWAALASHLLPGAFGMAFASARGWHRLACAIEDAGLRIHPSIFGWVYGSGFPKATRIDTQVDKRRPGKFNEIRSYLCKMIKQSGKTQKEIKAHLGYPLDSGVIGHWVGISQPLLPTTQDWNKMREILPIDDRFNDIFEDLERKVVGVGNSGIGTAFGDGEWSGRGAEDFDLTEPEHDLARAWAGHRYGLQALKPALEPIIVWQVPYDGKAVDSITRTGAGALNIDGARVGLEGMEDHSTTAKSGLGKHGVYGASTAETIEGKDLVRYDSKGRWPANLTLTCSCDPRRENKDEHPDESCPVRRLDEQSNDASHFFFNSDWNAEVEEGLLAADPAFYCAKAGRKERDAGLEAVPEKRGEELSGGGGVRHPKADAYQARKSSRRNSHPTVKPIKLCRWLATLLLPPEAYAPRRLLCPFAGTGSEMIAAVQAGWEHVRGIECEEEYVEIAKARLAYWSKRPVQETLLRDT